MSVIGYLVRIVNDEATSKQILYNKEEHKVYKTFSDALKRAEDYVKKAKYESFVCMIRSKSEADCEAYGYTYAYQITDCSTNIIIFALYAT